MTNHQLAQSPVAKAEMLIRRPVREVFEAFVDPQVTTRFWFTQGSGRLVAGEQVEWTWGMYDFSIAVAVKAIETDRRIAIEWPGEGGSTTVEWVFTARADGTTFVSITNRGFTGTADQIVQQALDSTEGFTLVLAGLKAFLEHHVELNLVADRFPKPSVYGHGG